MLSLKSRSFIFSIVLLVVAPAASGSLTCGERSPLFDKLGDQYFDTDLVLDESSPKLDISPDQLFNALQTLSLERGTGKRTVCTVNDVGKTPTSVDVSIEEIDIEVNTGEVFISALEVRSEERESHHEKIAISVDNRHVTIVNENELVEVRRKRQATAVGSQFDETRLELRRVGTGVNVLQLRYVNGELAEWIDWLLVQ